MDELLKSLELTKSFDEIWRSTSSYIVLPSTLAEIAMAIIISIVAYFLSKRTNIKSSKALAQKYKIVISDRTIDFFQDHLFGIFNSLFFCLSIIPFRMFKNTTHILSSGAILITTWVIINLLTSLIKNSLLSRFVTIAVWSIATLSILGLYGKTTKILDSISLTIGDIRISVYLVLKGIITIVFLLWLAKTTSDISEKSLTRSKSLTPSLRVLTSKMIRLFAYSMAILLSISSTGVNLTALTVFSGAIGIGVGFGLQKIVGNIVSGFIVLMDESIKPGDIIQLDEKFGTIKRMGARYISVVAWDGMEHLIPNEDIITSKVINWTHSDKHILISQDIGVSYNSDIHKVQQLILQAAQNFQRVLKDPTPQCYLREFGDSSVNFRLYFWIGDPEEGIMNIKSSVLFMIWDLLKENDISIPFPQRDIHIKSMPTTVIATRGTAHDI